MVAHVVTRRVTRQECPWLDRDYAEGEIVYVADRAEVTTSEQSEQDPPLRGCRPTPGTSPTIDLPATALVEYERTWEQTCYMPHDPEL